MNSKWYTRTTEKQMIGLKVRTLTELSNQFATIPSGTIMTIISKRRGVSLEGLPCKCCGVKVTIGGVPPEWFVLEES